MDLRPYQKEAVELVFKQWEQGFKRTLLVLPTGCGKTICFAKLTADEVANNHKVLILAHRGELLEQARDKLKKATGLDSALEKADSRAYETDANVVVASIQTLMNDKRLANYDPDYFNTIIIDEAHHALSDSYQRVLRYFGNANVLGVTATPDRGDKKNLGQFFESLAYEYTLPRAIKDGYLSRIMAQTVPLNIDLSSVRVTAGDYSEADIGTALEPYLREIADEIVKRCQDKKTVIFLPLIETSQQMADLLNERGLATCEVNGGSKNRAEILADFESGKYKAVCNSMLLTEGWDCPAVDCVIVLRPTKVRALYCQMIGRGTRLYDGKDNCLILDFLWHTERHELCRPACLISKKEDVQKELERMQDEAEEGIYIDEDTEKKADGNLAEQRKQAMARELETMRKKKAKLVDVLQFEMSILDDELSDYFPTFGWEMMPATEAQLKAIEKFGINPDGIENCGMASKILDRLVKRSQMGYSTPKQIRCLERFGFKDVGTWEFKEASKVIGILAANKWQVPSWLRSRYE